MDPLDGQTLAVGHSCDSCIFGDRGSDQSGTVLMDVLFPDSYEVSRARFLRDVEPLGAKWKSSRLEAHPLKNFPDLSIDWLWAEPTNTKNLIIVSTGQHGIEGYVGSAMLKIFIDEFATRLNTADTGILLVHALNPWGMKHGRKVNENGVDLNRNFILHQNFDPSINPDFSKLRGFLAPAYPVPSFAVENLKFIARIIRAIMQHGTSSVSTAALLGQYVSSKAMYYGGERYEEQTILMISLMHEALKNYENILHLDVHSGYGPRYQMSITTVPAEPRTSKELAAVFNYPLVLKSEGTEFYETNGDMCEYLYELRDLEYPKRHVFATTLEFGTYGASLLQRIHSLRTMIFESQLYWYGATQKAAEEKIRHEFRELYFPQEAAWCQKALADCRQALAGILSAHNILAV